MDKLDQPEINTSELTAVVRKAMARHLSRNNARPLTTSAEISGPGNVLETDELTRTIAGSADVDLAFLKSQVGTLPKAPRLKQEAVFESNSDDHYQLNDLLQFHDTDFLNAAYLAVLKREPDSVGYNYYLEELRKGHIDRVDVLAILRFSNEGKLKNVTIKGLARSTALRRLSHLPVIGYPIRLSLDLLRLPLLLHRIRQQEAYSLAQGRRLAEHIDEFAKHTDEVNDTLARSISNLSAAAVELSNRSNLQANLHQRLNQELQTLTEQQQVQHQALSRQQQNLSAQHQTLSEQQQNLSTQQQTLSGQQQNLSTQHQTLSAQYQILSARHQTLSAQHQALVERQQEITVELRQEFGTQIADELTRTYEQTQQLMQEQRLLLESLLEAESNDSRTRLAQLESSARAWTANLESSIGAQIANLDSSANELKAKITEAESTTGDLLARIVMVEAIAQDLATATHQLQSLTNTAQSTIEKVSDRLQHARTELALQGRRMALVLEEARNRLPAPFDQKQLETIAAEERHSMDGLYAELEDQFRGTVAEIKERFRTYLPLIESVSIKEELPIVDLGCGRGEWLELLKEAGYNAVGIDTNRVLLDRCRARGLEVIETDALKYLSGLPAGSLRAITGFHIIEHLPIDILMNLLDEIVRVVFPGGIVIFETPNPENVLVGSNFFYFDPTHRHPLPSLLMKFLLESRGLRRVEVMNLHAWEDGRVGGKSQLTARFNDLFYGPMDYAISGWKVSE